MDYQYKKFTVPMSSDNKSITDAEHQSNWDRIFGKKFCDACGKRAKTDQDCDTGEYLCGGCQEERAGAYWDAVADEDARDMGYDTLEERAADLKEDP